MKFTDYELPVPVLEKLFRAEVLLDDAYPLGEIGGGYQEIVAVCGGRFEGVINGEIMNFGGDWGLLHGENINDLNTKYLLKTSDSAYISIECGGKLIMSMEDMMAVCEDAGAADAAKGQDAGINAEQEASSETVSKMDLKAAQKSDPKISLKEQQDTNSKVSSKTESDYYFRQTIRFTTGAAQYRWLNEIVAIGVSIITEGGHICLDVYKVG